MCKFLRLALPVLLVGVVALVGSVPAQATCANNLYISAGLDGAPIDLATCTTSPSSAFWLVGYGAPGSGGVDNGTRAMQFDEQPWGGTLVSDWGNAGVHGCPLTYLQDDGTFGPMALLISGGIGEGTPSHSASYAALSADFYENFQFYSLDLVFGDIETGLPPGSQIMCNALAAPMVSGPTTGLVLSWPGVASLDDCATNPSIYAPDCSGGSRPLLQGWNVYWAHAACTLGTLTGDRFATGVWTKINAAPLAIGANAGTPPLMAPNPPAGKCLFLAYNPVWDSGFEGKYLSTPSGPVGGTVDTDLDGVFDNADNCPLVFNPAPQADFDVDLIGDACDNCPADVNYDQADANDNGLGDACDNCPTTGDMDHDGVCDDVDNCPNVLNPTQVDADTDGLGDACDACPLDPLNDADGDLVCGNVDNCPDVPNPIVPPATAQAETDGDGMGDACDPCPYEKFVPGQEGFDRDGDGICSCDAVLYNAGKCAGVPGLDNCPRVANANQTVSGFGDGLGSACEDRFLVAVLTPYDFAATNIGFPDKGFGDCRIRFKTTNEWNCPTFNVIYRSNKGDRATGVAPIACRSCTRGTGSGAVYYGGTSGAKIKYCHGGHGIYVQAVRSVNPSACPGFVNPSSVVGHPAEKLASRTR